MKTVKKTLISESYKDDQIGEIKKQGDSAYFYVPFTASGFKNMQEAKEFMRKHRDRMQKIIEKYCELSMTTKYLDKDTVAKAENKMVELVLKKLGYIS